MIGKARLRERIGCVSQKQSPQPLAMICKACPGGELAMFRKAASRSRLAVIGQPIVGANWL